MRERSDSSQRLPLAAVVALSVLVAGCMGPLASDELTSATVIWPEWTDVPELEEDHALAQQVLAGQGFDGTIVPLLSGFSGGHPVRFWDFGVAPREAAPIFMLVSDIAEDGTFTPVEGHPTIIDVVPGDVGYSPFWQVFLLPVTDVYDGELLTSIDAIQEAREQGLADAAVALDLYVNCPVVHRDTELEMPDGFKEPSQFFYKDTLASYYDLGMAPLREGTILLDVQPMYQLRREGGEPLDETVRGVDMTGDGDTADTNHVFAEDLDATWFSPLTQAVEAVVVTDTAAVDTYGDDQTSDVKGADDLFDDSGNPRSERLIALYPGDELRNTPAMAVDEGW